MVSGRLAALDLVCPRPNLVCLIVREEERAPFTISILDMKYRVVLKATLLAKPSVSVNLASPGHRVH